MTAVTAAAYLATQGQYERQAAEAYARGDDPDAVLDGRPILAAARDHLEQSRPLAEVKADYDAIQAARDCGGPYDAGAYAELAHELHLTRAVTAVFAGVLPGRAPLVTAGD